MVGLVQMTSTSNKEDNFCQAKSLIERAKQKGAQVCDMTFKWGDILLLLYIFLVKNVGQNDKWMMRNHNVLTVRR